MEVPGSHKIKVVFKESSNFFFLNAANDMYRLGMTTMGYP